MAIDQEFIDEYKQLLILQYSDSPNAVAEIDLLISGWSNIFDFLNSFYDEFDLDQAFGNRLDKIGAIVGVPRIIPEAIAKKYFGFAGVPNTLTFSEGAFFDLFKDSVYSSTQLNDAQYLFFIKSKISKNITSAYLVSDDRVTLQDTINFLFNGAAYIVDNFDMSLTLFIDDLFDADDIVLFLALDLLPKPQGVQYDKFISYSAAGTFGFSNNPNSKTFGAGKFAKIIFI